MKHLFTQVFTLLFLLSALPAAAANELVALPANATPETWTLTGLNVNPNNTDQYESLDEPVKVAIVGSDIYIQGLCAYSPSAWIKGSIDGTTATFPARQYVGSYANTPLYVIGYNGSAVDLTFNYNAEAGSLSTDLYMLVIDGEDNVWQMLQSLALYKGTIPEPETDTPVEAPEGLQTQEYHLTATSIAYNPDGSIADMQPASWNVRIGFVGTTEIYVQGFSQYFPEAWVRGTIDDDIVTFENGQYYGQNRSKQSFYFASMFLQAMADAEFSWDKTAGTLTGGGHYLLLNSSKTALAPYEVYAGVKLTRIADVVATPADPSFVNVMPFDAGEGYGAVELSIPTNDVDGNGILMDKLSYEFYSETAGKQEKITFAKSVYENLETDMTTIPYTFYDGWDFYLGGSMVVFYEAMADYDKVGVQSVYTGGNTERRSAIVWHNLKNTVGIGNVSTSDAADTYTDLQGRKATAATRGLLLKTSRTADGRTVTRKVIVK